MAEIKVLASKLEAIEGEVGRLHDCLESKGVNSRRVAGSLHGDVFALPVDAEHKARQLKISNCSIPHMRGEFCSRIASAPAPSHSRVAP